MRAVSLQRDTGVGGERDGALGVQCRHRGWVGILLLGPAVAERHRWGRREGGSHFFPRVFWPPTRVQPTACTFALRRLKFGPTEGGYRGGGGGGDFMPTIDRGGRKKIGGITVVSGKEGGGSSLLSGTQSL